MTFKKAGTWTPKALREELIANLDAFIEKEEAKDEAAAFTRSLPNINTLVLYPIHDPKSKDHKHNGTYRNTIHSIVLDLFDHEGWSREQIADWLDDLHDEGKVDLSFPTS